MSADFTAPFHFSRSCEVLYFPPLLFWSCIFRSCIFSALIKRIKRDWRQKSLVSRNYYVFKLHLSVLDVFTRGCGIDPSKYMFVHVDWWYRDAITHWKTEGPARCMASDTIVCRQTSWQWEITVARIVAKLWTHWYFNQSTILACDQTHVV